MTSKGLPAELCPSAVMRPLRHLLLGTALVACSTSDAHDSVSPTKTLVAPDPPMIPVHAVVPEALRGPFHLGGHLDEINLVLEDDGSFRWRIFGCDFTGTGSGEWTLTKDGVDLHASPGKPLVWMDETSFANPVVLVHVRTAPGAIAVEALRAASGDLIRQTWVPGRMCASCGHGTLGPDRPPRACDDPMP